MLPSDDQNRNQYYTTAAVDDFQDVRLDVSSDGGDSTGPTIPKTPNVGAKFDANLAKIYDGGRAAYEADFESTGVVKGNANSDFYSN